MYCLPLDWRRRKLFQIRHRFQGHHECHADCTAQLQGVPFTWRSENYMHILYKGIQWSLAFTSSAKPSSRWLRIYMRKFCYNLKFGSKQTEVLEKSILMAWRLQLKSQIDGHRTNSATC